MSHHTTQKDRETFIKLFNEGLSLKEISEKTNFGIDTISKHLKSHGILNIKRKRLFGQEQDVVNFYLQCDHLDQTCKHFSETHTVIRRILQENNIKITKSKYSLDEKFFTKIDSPEKAYILGFIFADGGVYNNTLSICQHNKDIDLIKKINNILGSNRPLFKRDEYIALNITNANLKDDLAKYGVVQNKTFKIRFPKIEKKYYSHFIRGYFDGDGYFYINKKSPKWRGVWAVCANDLFAKDICKILNENNFSASVCKNKRQSISELRIYSQDHIYNIYQWLYANSNLYMPRKKDKMLEFIHHYLDKQQAERDKANEIKGLKSLGLSGPKIAQKTGISIYTVYKILNHQKTESL